jgi:uncharacterized repeat protein (TIGR03809 family)
MSPYWTTQKFSTEYRCHVQLIRRVASASVFLLTGLFMTQRFDVVYPRDILARWCDLAEQRLQHLTEMFESGRWRRYHGEEEFLENILEARSAVEVWRSLSTPGTSHDTEVVRGSWAAAANSHPAVGVSPAVHARMTLPRQDARRDPVQPVSPPPLPFPGASRPLRLSMPPAPVRIVASKAASAPAVDMPAVKHDPLPDDARPDIAAMQRRYPLLRNAM